MLVAYDESLATWSAPGLYLGGMACMYYTWLHHVRPLVHPLNTVGITKINNQYKILSTLTLTM